MRKPENTVKFPEKIGKSTTTVQTFDTAEEAITEAKAQAAAANVPPSSIMVTYKDGYVTGDGEVHGATGITAPPRTPPKPAEATLQVPAEEDYEPKVLDDVEVKEVSLEPEGLPETSVTTKDVKPEKVETPELEIETSEVEVETPVIEDVEAPEVEVETKAEELVSDYYEDGAFDATE